MTSTGFLSPKIARRRSQGEPTAKLPYEIVQLTCVTLTMGVAGKDPAVSDPPPMTNADARAGSEKAKMLEGRLYDPWDPELIADRERCRKLTTAYNNTKGEKADRCYGCLSGYDREHASWSQGNCKGTDWGLLSPKLQGHPASNNRGRDVRCVCFKMRFTRSNEQGHSNSKSDCSNFKCTIFINHR